MTAFDAIIIGAGQAGPPLAGRLTGAGMKVALVERALFGGTCVNTGCTPTKTLVASAYAAHLARRARSLRRRDRGQRHREHGARQGARRRRGCDARAPASRAGCAAWRAARCCAGTPPSNRPRRCAWATTCCRRGASSSMWAGAPRCRVCRASARSRTSTTARSSRWTACPSIWWWWAGRT